jgi:hypothetical protein
MVMIEYINRRGRLHYLHEGKTKTGKPKYFFSIKLPENPVRAIPDGYEIYENPNAQVFLRKIPPQIITPEEIEIVVSGIKKYTKLDYFIVDVKGKNIIVYTCDQNVDTLIEITSSTYGADSSRARNAIASSLSYTAMMQFVLEDIKTREFVVERWCFQGSVDDWIPLADSPSLEELVRKYISHLGEESFFDLIPDYE